MVCLSEQIFVFYLFLIFIFLLFSNFIGLLPFSFTVSSHFSFTFYMALSFFIGLIIFGIKTHSWKFFAMFLPAGVPLVLSPLLIILELVSFIARVFSLSIRLFANMMAGHTLLKILSNFLYLLLTQLKSLAAWLYCPLLPLLLIFIVTGLEFAIAGLQAYVFLVLLTLYLNDICASNH